MNPVRKVLLGGLVAVIVALPFAIPEIAGVATWKIVLAAIGLVLFAIAGRD
jgi:hypothetical protein